jgi:hypothetical protein
MANETPEPDRGKGLSALVMTINADELKSYMKRQRHLEPGMVVLASIH